jgi:hypothetical protein
MPLIERTFSKEMLKLTRNGKLLVNMSSSTPQNATYKNYKHDQKITIRLKVRA